MGTRSCAGPNQETFLRPLQMHPIISCSLRTGNYQNTLIPLLPLLPLLQKRFTNAVLGEYRNIQRRIGMHKATKQMLARPFVLQADEKGQLKCYHLEVLADLPPAKLHSLPPDAVIVQFKQMDTSAAAAAPDQAGNGGDAAGDEPPEHFLELRVTGQVACFDNQLI